MPAYGALHSSFKAQPIDELTGDGGPMNVWTNGSATSFKDRVLNGGFDANDFHACPNIKSDQDLNDAVFGVKENIDWTAANGGPGGSTFMTGQFEMPTDNVGGNSGPGGTTF